MKIYGLTTNIFISTKVHAVYANVLTLSQCAAKSVSSIKHRQSCMLVLTLHNIIHTATVYIDILSVNIHTKRHRTCHKYTTCT